MNTKNYKCLGTSLVTFHKGSQAPSTFRTLPYRYLFRSCNNHVRVLSWPNQVLCLLNSLRSESSQRCPLWYHTDYLRLLGTFERRVAKRSRWCSTGRSISFCLVWRGLGWRQGPDCCISHLAFASKQIIMRFESHE